MRLDNLRGRQFARNAIPEQSNLQGSNSRELFNRNIRQTRQVQPGNELKRVLRIGNPDGDIALS